MDRSRMSRQELIRLRRREGFVGRRGEIAVFRDNFARVVEDPAHQFLFHVHGQAGVGKTSLIRQFENTAREQGAPTAYIDEAVHGVPDAMAAVSGQLAAQGRPLKAFDKLFTAYRERRHEVEAAVVAAEEQSSVAVEPGDSRGPAPSPGSVIAAQAGLAGLGLLPGVGAVTGALDPRQVARGAERLRGLLSARLRNHDDVQLVMSPLEVLTPVFVREMSAVADEVPWLALFFDTYERTGPLLDVWLRDVLVTDRYGPLAPNVVVTLAGQTALDRRCWADHLDCVAELGLDAFTEAEARQFLATRGVVDERVVEVILRLSGGLPVLVSTLAESRPRAAEAVDDPSDTAVERFLKWETDLVRREAALAAALPRHLDEDVFRAVVDTAAAELFGWLCGLPFVADRAGRWQYHEVVRTAMLRLQRRRSPQTWTARHRRLAEAARRHRSECAADADPVRSWTDERWVEHRLRETYHALCADPQQALPSALADIVDAAEYERSVVRRVAESLRQAGEDAGADEVRGWGDRLAGELTEGGGGLIAVLTALLARPGGEAAEQARIHRIRGGEYRKAEAWPQAFADYDRCLELAPHNVPALLGRGLTHRYMRAFERAAEDYVRALEITPDSVDAASQLGEVYRLMGRLEQAVTEFDRALSGRPRHAFTLASRAVCLRRLGHHEEALAGLERAIEINAEYAWAMAERGATYREMGRYDLALAEFDRALAINPGYIWAHARRGITLRVMGRYDEALAALGRACELQPEDPWVWGERCNTYLDMRRYEQALVEAERSLAADPAYAWAHRARGIALHALGRHEEALEALDRSLELDADRTGPAHEQRGLVLQTLGRAEEARLALSAALRLTPDSARALAARGETNLHTGRLSEALADYDRLIELATQQPPEDTEATASATVPASATAPAPTQVSASAMASASAFAFAFAQRGKVHVLRGDDSRALADFDRALAEGGPTTALLVLKAGCLRRSGHLDAARETFGAAGAAGAVGPFGAFGAFGVAETPREEGGPLADVDGVLASQDGPLADQAGALLGQDDALVGLMVRYEAALLAGALGGVDAAEFASAWEALRADAIHPVPAGAPTGNDNDPSTLNPQSPPSPQGPPSPLNPLHAPNPLDPQSPPHAPLSTAFAVAVAVISRCALGDWAGADGVIAELLDGGPWEPLAWAELGVRELARLPGADAERLEAIRDGLIRRMAEAAGGGPDGLSYAPS
ncbi:tetratricopeptide repeat protein [Streptomyces sp. NPDC002446]